MEKMFLCSYFAGVADLLADFADEELQGKSVAFISTAGNVEKINFFIGAASKAFDRLGMKINELDITQLSNDEVVSVIENSDYIYVSGGNTFYLLQELQRHSIDATLSEQVKNGKPYIGESAGAIITAPDLEYMRAVNFDPIAKAPELQNCFSLGLADLYIIPHYSEFPFKKKGEKIVKLYGENLNLLAINNKQAVFVNDGKYEIKTI